jgi:ABC-type multidrug transport system fused ATPase/permease subunit
VAGIVLTFELGLNRGNYARAVGPILGPMICMEALTAFFLEAGFFGILVWGEGRISKRVTMIATCMVALGALLSTAWILDANSWMQTPAGYREVNGQFQPTNWYHTIFNPAFNYRFPHMVLAVLIASAWPTCSAPIWPPPGPWPWYWPTALGWAPARCPPRYWPAPASSAWARGGIALRGLVAGMGDEPALSIRALHLPGGGVTVLTGASGAGKSTLLRVLAAPLRPMAGSVRIGGTNPHALRYEDLVAAATFMEQHSQLLSGTVADNLRLARPDASADELGAAMKVAVLAGHVDLESQVGPGGEGLSGGQRRRLSVAQAYLRHPGLLLLDEPTEGLDHQTARVLLENLRSALPGATIIAAIHDRTFDHLPVPADATVRLAAGRVLQVT